MKHLPPRFIQVTDINGSRWLNVAFIRGLRQLDDLTEIETCDGETFTVEEKAERIAAEINGPIATE